MSQTVQPAAQPARRRQSRDRVVQTRRDQNAKTQNDVQLKVDGRTAPIKQPPAQHDEEIQGQDHHRGPRMGETQTDEQVVKVRLVRLERRHTADDTSAHHAQRVEHRYGKNRQREGNEPEIRKPELPAERIVPECPDDEHRDDDAQHERAAVPDEHLGPLPVHVMKKERNKRTRADRSENGHATVARKVEQCPEQHARKNAVTRRKPVHAVDQVDRVDDANRRENSKRHRNPDRNDSQTPQTVEIVDTVMPYNDQKNHGSDLDHETNPWRETQNVVHRSRVKHHGHSHHNHEKLRTVSENTRTAETYNRTQKYANSAQNWNRTPLKLPARRLVHDVLQLRDTNHPRMDVPYAQQPQRKRQQNLPDYQI